MLTLTLTNHNRVGLTADTSRDSFLFFMDYKSSCPHSPHHGHIVGGGRGHMSDLLEEQLLTYSENAENEGEEVEYLEEEEELQVHTSQAFHSLNHFKHLNALINFDLVLFDPNRDCSRGGGGSILSRNPRF